MRANWIDRVGKEGWRKILDGSKCENGLPLLLSRQEGAMEGLGAGGVQPLRKIPLESLEEWREETEAEGKVR